MLENLQFFLLPFYLRQKLFHFIFNFPSHELTGGLELAGAFCSEMKFVFKMLCNL